MSKDTLRPEYYNTDSVYEPIKIIQHYGLCFEIANNIKYCLRAGVKNKETEIEDLVKAKTYLQLRIDYLQAQKDLTINIKCENNLSPVLEEIHEKVTKIKEDSTINEYRKSLISLVELMGVKDGRDVYEFVDSILNIQLKDLKKEEKPKLISELKVGDEIKAIKDLYMDGSEDLVDISLVEGRGYSIKGHTGKQIIIKSEYDENHYFPLSDLHEYFHVSK